MAFFTKGQKITKFDYNNIVGAVNEIWADNYKLSQPSNDVTTQQNMLSYGWGQLPSDYVGDIPVISAEIVNKIIDRLNVASDQTSSAYVLDNVAQGQIITASILNDIQFVLDDVTIRKNILPADQATIRTDSSITNESINWSRTATFSAQYAFASYDEARYFFNAGGNIRMSMTEWEGGGVSYGSLYDKVGVITLKLFTTTSSTPNTITEDLGFLDLDSTDKLLLSAGVTSAVDGYGYGGYGSYGTYGGYGGYGGYTGSNAVSFNLFASIKPQEGTDYQTGPVFLTFTVKVSHSNDATAGGEHRLDLQTVYATDKTSGSADFSITPPVFNPQGQGSYFISE